MIWIPFVVIQCLTEIAARRHAMTAISSLTTIAQRSSSGDALWLESSVSNRFQVAAGGRDLPSFTGTLFQACRRRWCGDVRGGDCNILPTNVPSRWQGWQCIFLLEPIRKPASAQERQPARLVFRIDSPFWSSMFLPICPELGEPVVELIFRNNNGRNLSFPSVFVFPQCV
jgi:hypothetical protein